MSNPGSTGEDRKASLTFRGMKEELCIFNRTQEVIARYGDSLQILSYKTHLQDMVASRRLVKEACARCLSIGYLERRIPKIL